MKGSRVQTRDWQVHGFGRCNSGVGALLSAIEEEEQAKGGSYLYSMIVKRQSGHDIVM